MNVLAGQPWIRCSKCTLYLVGYWSEVIITFPPADVAVADSPGATAIRDVVASFDSTAGALVVGIQSKGYHLIHYHFLLRIPSAHSNSATIYIGIHATARAV